METDSKLQFAFDEISREIAKLGRADVSLAFAQGGSLLEIFLGREARTKWLGYSQLRQGFYLTDDPDQEGRDVFPLSEREVRALLIDAPRLSYHDELSAAVMADQPEADLVARLVEELPASNEGIDILAVAATLRSCRAAVDELRQLLESQERERHKEDIYRSLVGRKPWLLGAYLDEVVFREKQIWLDSRVDLAVQSVTGYLEIVEFKRPEMPLLVPGKGLASWFGRTWRRSSELSDAWAQAERYLDHIDQNRLTIQDHLARSRGVPARLYRSTVLIIAGRSPDNPDAQDALRATGSQSRVALWTYDSLLAVGERVLNLFERRVK